MATSLRLISQGSSPQGTVLLSALDQLLALNDRGQAAGNLSLSANNTTANFP
jgi:hypothetical protein